MIYAILAMGAIVVASNVGVQFLIADGWLTWGAFSYPLAFLVTDVTNRLYGTEKARKVVLAGFAVGLVCSLIGTQIMGEFGPLVTLRIALASGTAFLVAQLIDLGVFSTLRNRAWWVAPLTSSVVGSIVDTALFFTIAFAGFLA
ncbi:MAG: queuosine precursor transporter, partial [Pseudomonadota bacterium]